MDSEENPIKEIFYQEIKKQDQTKIQKLIQEKKSKLLIDEIISNSVPQINKISDTEKFGTFFTVLLHYFLTNCVIPSQRKIKKDNVELDLVIPDIQTLNKSPNDAIIIGVPKTNILSDIKKQTDLLEKIQPNRKNIWVVLEKKIEIPFQLFDIDSISEIINDIEKFLSEHNIKRLKILKSGF